MSSFVVAVLVQWATHNLSPRPAQDAQKEACLDILTLLLGWSPHEIRLAPATLIHDQSSARLLRILGWEAVASRRRRAQQVLAAVAGAGAAAALTPHDGDVWANLVGPFVEPSTGIHGKPVDMAIGQPVPSFYEEPPPGGEMARNAEITQELRGWGSDWQFSTNLPPERWMFLARKIPRQARQHGKAPRR